MIDVSIDFSAVVPCYNQGEFLLDAIASLETCQEELIEVCAIEIVIVDDGSTEPLTQQVLGALERQGYRVLRQANAGLATARNTGIAAATGRYILPLDADNRVRPAYFAVSREVLGRNPAIGVVYASAQVFGETTGIWTAEPFDGDRLSQANYIDACAPFRKAVWEMCGGYDPALPAFEDWDFWLRAHHHGWRFAACPEVIGFDYRVRSRSLSQDYGQDRYAAIAAYIQQKHPQRL
jgi:glycosyltransferase involved in cell wall biosynthesis